MRCCCSRTSSFSSSTSERSCWSGVGAGVLDASAEGVAGAAFDAVWACAQAPAVSVARVPVRLRIVGLLRVHGSTVLSFLGVLHLCF